MESKITFRGLNSNRLIVCTLVLFLVVSCKNKPDNLPGNYLNALNARKTYLWIEAENPREMADKSFVIVEDSSSFGGKYIKKPSGVLKLKFEVPHKANYKIFGRVFTKNGNADSWKFILVNENRDTIAKDVWNNINANRRFEWAWDEITTGRTTSDMWRPFLEQGVYTFNFIARDADDCMLDKLLVTDDTAFVPDVNMKSVDKTYLSIEAESGEMSAPFKTGRGEDSDNEFAWVEKANAVYDFQIDQPGQYRIWGYVKGEDGSSDSVFGSVDDEPGSTWSFALDGIWQKWKWIPYNTRDSDSIVHDFDAGMHRIVLDQRESGAKVDALLVTNDIDYVPENRKR